MIDEKIKVIDEQILKYQLKIKELWKKRDYILGVHKRNK